MSNESFACVLKTISPLSRAEAASGLVGQAVGFGVILDFTKYMNRVAGFSEGTSAVTVEDGVVPLRNLPAYIAGLKKILDKYSVAFTVYGHAGMGHIHCSTFEEIATEAGRERIERATQEVFDLIIKLDGVFSAEPENGVPQKLEILIVPGGDTTTRRLRLQLASLRAMGERLVEQFAPLEAVVQPYFQRRDFG